MSQPTSETEVGAGPGPAEIAALLAWFESRQRRLPWRDAAHGQRAPYRVWVSEIMLQQTRVEVVIDFFENWMRRFPSVEALAAAAEDEVLQAWAGLGYYRRARFLQAGAQALVEGGASGMGGKAWPQSAAEWQSIPGVGPYTAAAIASLAGDEAVGVVDGNVKRVVARHAGLQLAADDRRLHRAAESWMAVALATARPPGLWNEAVMELGATVCTPKSPLCGECALQEGCWVNESGVEQRSERSLLAPAAPAPKTWVELELGCALHADSQGRVLLRQRTEGWNPGLFEPPTVVLGASLSKTAQRSYPLATLEDLPGELGEELGVVRHTITHHKMQARVFRLRTAPLAAELARTPGLALVDPAQVGLTGLARKILKTWL